MDDIELKVQEFVNRGDDAYKILGLNEPPPNATIEQFKDKLYNPPSPDKKMEFNRLMFLVKSERTLKAYNEARSAGKTNILEHQRRMEELRRQKDQMNRQQYEKREREYNEEYERQERERKERMMKDIIIAVELAKKDEEEMRKRRSMLIGTYVASFVLSIVGLFLLTIPDAYIMIIAPWIVIFILTFYVLRDYTGKIVIPWIIIALFVTGAVIWGVMVVGGTVDIFTDAVADYDFDLSSSVVASVLLLVACALPIVPIHKMFISVKITAEDIQDAEKMLVEAFGER
jgi:hypothetical protein